MYDTLLACLGLGAMPLLVAGPYLFNPFSVPKKAFVGGLAFVVLCLWAWAGEFTLNLGPAFVPLLAYLGWATVRGVFAQRSAQALEMLTWQVGLFMVCLVALPLGGLVVKLLFAAAAINALLAITQNRLRYEPMKWCANVNYHYPTGLIGNTNMLGCFLVPALFVGVSMVHMSLIVWVGLALVAYALYLTKCRSALVGLVTGGLGFTVSEWGWEVGLTTGYYLAVSGFVLFLLRPQLFTWRHEPVIARLATWQNALRKLRRCWLFGLGFDNYRLSVPYINEELNKESNGAYLEEGWFKDPWPCRAHSDILQGLLDNGVIGLALVGWVIYTALTSNMSSYEIGALCAFLGCGLAFHPSTIAPCAVWFWWLTASAGSGTALTVSLPVGVWVFVVTTVAFVLYKTALVPLLYDRALNVVKIGKFPKDAIVLMPDRSEPHCYAAQYQFTQLKPWQMFKHTIHALGNFDGSTRLWEIWCNLGTALFMSGAFWVAEQCYIRSLELFPRYEPAQQALSNVRDAMQKVGLSGNITTTAIKEVREKVTKLDTHQDKQAA